MDCLCFLRFPTDESREKLYRAEVQGRVWKRELAEREADIARLEKILNSPHSSSNDSLYSDHVSKTLQGGGPVSSMET